MSKPEIVPLHTKWPTFDERTRTALKRAEVTYTRDEVMRIMGEAILAEREACARVCEEVGEHPSLTPRHCAESIRARSNT